MVSTFPPLKHSAKIHLQNLSAHAFGQNTPLPPKNSAWCKMSLKVCLAEFVYFIQECVVVASFQPKIPENYNAFCSAAGSNKQNPCNRTSDLPFFFRYKPLKANFRWHMERVSPTGFNGQILRQCLF